MRFLALIVSFLLFFGAAQAQTISNATTTQSSSTIAVTNTFQSVIAAATGFGSGQRKGCLIQNQGSNVMYVFFGAIAGATTGKSIQLQPPQSSPVIQGGTVSCTIGNAVLQDQVSITGTSTEAFVYTVNY